MFVIIFFGLLLVGSTAAAYFNQRTPFLLLFSLTIVSMVLGIVGGASALQTVISACA